MESESVYNLTLREQTHDRPEGAVRMLQLRDLLQSTCQTIAILISHMFYLVKYLPPNELSLFFFPRCLYTCN